MFESIFNIYAQNSFDIESNFNELQAVQLDSLLRLIALIPRMHIMGALASYVYRHSNWQGMLSVICQTRENLSVLGLVNGLKYS